MPVTIDFQLINCSNWGQANVHVSFVLCCDTHTHTHKRHSTAKRVSPTWLILMTDKDNEDDACENELNSSSFSVCLFSLSASAILPLTKQSTRPPQPPSPPPQPQATDHWSLARWVWVFLQSRSPSAHPLLFISYVPYPSIVCILHRSPATPPIGTRASTVVAAATAAQIIMACQKSTGTFPLA